MTSLTRVRGSAWDTSDNLVVDLISDLAGISREGIIFVSGGLTVNDGLGGWFRYEPLELRSNHDGHNIIDPTGTTAGRGCWVRQQYDTAPQGINVSEVQQASAGQTTFNLQHIRYAPGEGSIAVYVNGTRLTPWSFTEIDAKTVMEKFPESEQAEKYRKLSVTILDNDNFVIPQPMDAEEFDAFFREFQ